MPRSALTSSAPATTDPAEVAKFGRMAATWWDPDGPMKPLHRINPVRLAYLRARIVARFGRDDGLLRPLEGLDLLDIGCGAGLVCEPMARLGATVTGIDPSPEIVAAASLHAEESGLAVNYRATTVEALSAAGARFDVVLALEVVEHVAEVATFIRAAANCLRPGGVMILSTINRTLRAYGLAILGAEYVLRWLPVGTHDWERFVRPDELARMTGAAGLVAFSRLRSEDRARPVGRGLGVACHDLLDPAYHRVDLLRRGAGERDRVGDQ